jgi:hypothetical protein
MDEDEEDEEENSVDNLMELDIISFDSEDLDFLESEDESGIVPPIKCGRFEIDPCCFNFDWNGNNVNTGMNNQTNKPSTYNLCGLEAWGMNGSQSNKSIPNAVVQTGRGELQQKQGSLFFQSQHQQSNHHAMANNSNINTTSFFYSR